MARYFTLDLGDEGTSSVWAIQTPPTATWN